MSVDFGGVTFDIVRGYPQPLKTRNETWEVPGLDGVGAQTLGQGNARTQMTGVAYLFDNGDFAANNAAADALILAAAALQGTLIANFTDSFGTEYYNFFVEEMDCSGKDLKKACIYQGDPNAVRVALAWRGTST